MAKPHASPLTLRLTPSPTTRITTTYPAVTQHGAQMPYRHLNPYQYLPEAQRNASLPHWTKNCSSTTPSKSSSHPAIHSFMLDGLLASSRAEPIIIAALSLETSRYDPGPSKRFAYAVLVLVWIAFGDVETKSSMGYCGLRTCVGG